MPGGQPSITQPMAGPWDSPKVVTVNNFPKLLLDTLPLLRNVYRIVITAKAGMTDFL
jgi:hypothetical protein